MSRALFSIVAASLFAMTVLASGVATATTTIDVNVEYDYDSASKCVTGIRVSVPDKNYQEPHHPKNVEISQQELLTEAFEVKWNLIPSNPVNAANIKWQIKKLGTYSSSTKCKLQYDFPQGTIARKCDVNKIAEVKNTEIWTYDVLPDHPSTCCKVEADPAIIFRGGGGGLNFKPLLWAVIGGVVALLATFLLTGTMRRART